MTTKAFCTVLLVTSSGRCSSSLASICLVHDTPNADVQSTEAGMRRRRVKYEKSSYELLKFNKVAGALSR